MCSVCHAYCERMSIEYTIRSHVLKCFEHGQKNNLATAYNNVQRRMSAYEERAWRMRCVFSLT